VSEKTHQDDDYDHRYATALHEATHAIVALALGLPVLWVSILPGYDEEEDIEYPAAVKIRDEAKQYQRHVLVAMAAPSFLPTGDEGIDTYAELEAGLAYERAEDEGLAPDSIRYDAERQARRGRARINALAERLVAEGRVEFDSPMYVHGCPCAVSEGARQWDRYERTGVEPDWRFVRSWRARQHWLANARKTTRRGLRGPRS
jgi:hypothetical protein